MHRAITVDDFEVVFRIYMDAENNPFLTYDPMSRAEFRPLYDELVRAGETFLVVEGDSVLATYRLTRGTGRTAHCVTLGAFAAHPDQRGRGAGTRAVAAITERLRGEGVRRLDLFVEADNPKAIRFYEKVGFQREGVLRAAFKRSTSDALIDEIAMAMLF